ncbi:tetratricopeptide repeat protein [Amycolatopsis regifaucium]|uniref:tetratricopeptide repeat protein n=1 Tax=Amycolatopsis regifaucium TaxID=546365 RepID=UPI0011600DD8|nr:transcriptional regulator [Amycolatopsis regifaucium]
MTDPEATARRHLAPDQVGKHDVEALETQTKALRAVDYQCGGGMCRDAVVVRIHRGHRMLAMSISEPVRARLFSAVADLHNLAGWTCFDSGQVGAAHHHLDVALELAADAGDAELAANIHYRRGRIHLHYGATDEALTQFELGRLAARRAGSKLAASILSANQGWAYAKKGDANLAVGLMERAGEEFAEKDDREPPDWARFFTEIDVSAMAGSVHTDLALRKGGRHIGMAISALADAVRGYGPEMARSRSLCLSMLATDHVLGGDGDEALSVGIQAIESAETLKSVRTRDRLRPLEQEAAKHPDDADCRALSEAVTLFVTGRDQT